MAVTVLQCIASMQQIGLLSVLAIKVSVYSNTHSNYSQPDLLNYTIKILVGIVTPLHGRLQYTTEVWHGSGVLKWV